MAKKLGEALKAMVGEVESGERRRTRKESPLLNRNRLIVFQYLCRVPCSHLRSVADGVALGTATVAWHLDRLVQSGLVQERRVGTRKVYYPSKLVSADAVPCLHAATDPVVRGSLIAVMSRPGATVREVSTEVDSGESAARRALKTLVSVGLVDHVRDGRFWRYFPAEAIDGLSSDSRKRVRQFKRSLLRDLQRNGLNPEVDVSPRGESVIAVTAGSTRIAIVVPDDPLESILTSGAEVG